MRRKRIDDIFTPRNAIVNKSMYINREQLEEELLRKIRTTQHVIIFGESGCGKSWLYKKVLAENRIYYKTVNLSLISDGVTIDTLLESLVANEQAEQAGYTEKNAAEINAVIAKGTIDHESKYVIRHRRGLFNYLNYYFSRQGGFICFENIEIIFKNPRLMDELGRLIILLDDEDFAKYNTKFIITGVPSGVLKYYGRSKNISSIANRVIELSEVTPMSYKQVKEFINRGFIEMLKVSFQSGSDLNNLANHIYYITCGVPQRMHEYCRVLAYEIEENKWTFQIELLRKADEIWLRNQLIQYYEVVQDLMNSEGTEIGRRNQVLYCLGKIDGKSFSLQQIEGIVRKEFPKYCAGKKLNLSIPLGDIAENKVSFLSKQGKVYYITDMTYILCLRTMLKKSVDERVNRIDLSNL